MTIPDEIADLVQQRNDARSARDFARADALRDQIEAAGYTIVDTPDGAHVEERAAYELVDPSRIEDALDAEPTKTFSFHVLYEGYPDDVERFLTALAEHDDLSDAEVILVANGAYHDEVASFADRARTVHLSERIGWAAARNAGIKQSAGALIVLVDLSVEPTGAILAPLQQAFDDPDVGAAGPFGLKTANMRLFADDPGPEVDALEGYLLAVRREILRDTGLIHEKFQWYRNADIDLCFQIRATGKKAIVVELPVAKHTHRGWTDASEEDRKRLSKRNHYTFFDRWKNTPLGGRA